MACLLVPAMEAVVMTVAGKIIKEKEQKSEGLELSENQGGVGAVHIPLSRKVRWLTNLLWGGSALLAFEHLWHGEIIPWYPFLTAATNPGDAAVMLHEMSTVGVTMAVVVTAAWGGMLAVSYMLEKRLTESFAKGKGGLA